MTPPWGRPRVETGGHVDGIAEGIAVALEQLRLTVAALAELLPALAGPAAADSDFEDELDRRLRRAQMAWNRCLALCQL